MDVLIVPNASQTHIVGPHGDRVKVRVSSPPEKGRANKALVDLLVEVTGATSAAVVAGAASRRKTVELRGVGMAAVQASLRGLADGV